jgi:hypothetical protein
MGHVFRDGNTQTATIPTMQARRSTPTTNSYHRRADIPVRSNSRMHAVSGFVLTTALRTANVAADRNVRAPVLRAWPRRTVSRIQNSPASPCSEAFCLCRCPTECEAPMQSAILWHDTNSSAGKAGRRHRDAATKTVVLSPGNDLIAVSIRPVRIDERSLTLQPCFRYRSQNSSTANCI